MRKDNENIRTGSIKENCKKSLFVKLVNTERNKSLVEQSISKEFLDLSAVVRVVLKMDKEGMASMTLSKRDAEILGIQSIDYLMPYCSNYRKMVSRYDFKNVEKDVS